MTYGNIKATRREQEQRAAVVKKQNLDAWYDRHPREAAKVANRGIGSNHEDLGMGANIYDDHGDDFLVAGYFDIPNM